MDPNQDLIIDHFIVNLNSILNKFSEHVNEKFSNITDDLNRCQANLVILEKKIEGIQQK